MGTFKLAVVIPAYNEANTISNVVNRVKPFGDVIVVNDCSIDTTAEQAYIAGAIVVTHDNNKGYDGALNSGFEFAYEKGYSSVITFDADGQHSEKLLASFIEHLKVYDLVLGIRPKNARLGEKIFAFASLSLYGVKDPLCGMKGYNMLLYKKLGYFDAISSIGTELALSSIKQGCSYIQLPIPIAEREDSSRFGHIFKANLTIIKALFRYFKKYHLGIG